MPRSSPDRPAASSSNLGIPKGEGSSRYRRLWWFSVVFTAFVSLTPLVIMTLVNFYQYERTFTAEMIQPIAGLTSTSGRFITDFLVERRAALSYVVRREPYEDLCDPAKLGRVFHDMKESFGGLVDLGVIDSDGSQRSYVGPFSLEGKNYKEQDWFHDVYVRGAHVSDVFTGYRGLPHFVIAVRKDLGEEGGFYILRATIDTEVLNRHIASLNLRPSSDAFLINRQGVLQTPSRYYGGILESCPVGTPPFSTDAEVLEVTDKQGNPKILGYAYIEQSPFIFVVLKQPGQVMQSWVRLRSYVLWLLVGSMALILAVILFGSSYLVNRIREADARRNMALHKISYANKMASIGRMAAGVAHEINNPLAIVNENAGLLKDLIAISDEPPDRKRLLSIADAVLKSVERASTITHRLLGFAKRMDPAVDRIPLGQLLEEVLSFQGREAEYRNITVNLVVPDDLPIIESDRGQLQQVFLNILSNAFAAVDDGGQIDVIVEQETDDAVTVIVRDNGPGIPEHDLPHIFEPFFSTKGDYGTGLGLSITYGIIENLGGRIEVRSKPGEGATFIVRLPLRSRS